MVETIEARYIDPMVDLEFQKTIRNRSKQGHSHRIPESHFPGIRH